MYFTESEGPAVMQWRKLGRAYTTRLAVVGTLAATSTTAALVILGHGAPVDSALIHGAASAAMVGGMGAFSTAVLADARKQQVARRRGITITGETGGLK